MFFEQTACDPETPVRPARIDSAGRDSRAGGRRDRDAVPCTTREATSTRTARPAAGVRAESETQKPEHATEAGPTGAARARIQVHVRVPIIHSDSSWWFQVVGRPGADWNAKAASVKNYRAAACALLQRWNAVQRTPGVFLQAPIHDPPA